MSEPRDDKELEDWLAGESPLSRRYRALGDEEPPAEIDRRILADAAAASNVVPLERPTRRWGASIAVAATVLLCVSIVVNLSIQPEGPLSGEAPPAVEFADERPAPSFGVGAPSGNAAQLEQLRRQSRPSAAPPSVESFTTDAGKRESSSADSAARTGGSGFARERVDTGVEPSLQRPQLARPPSSRGDEWLMRAVTLIRQRVAAQDAEESQPGPGRDGPAKARPDADLALEAILDAWDADDAALARERLEAFLRDNPEHPLSLEITGAG